MSWAFSCIGKPAQIADALERYGALQVGQTKIEFYASMPHLIALVRENFSDEGNDGDPLIDFEACGAGRTQSVVAGDPKQSYRTCEVSIKLLKKTLVL